MLRLFAILLGIAFIFAGVAGYMPMFMKDGLLLGHIEVDNMHNMIHIVTGVIAIMAATSYRLTKIFFAIFGIIYTLIAILGFWQAGNLVVTHTNMAGNIFHLVVGIIAIYLGFSKWRHVEAA